jgi:hypothetical protein
VGFYEAEICGYEAKDLVRDAEARIEAVEVGK